MIDVTGGMFGVIGILAALEQRRRTGVGQAVDCSLFETTAFLVGQHIAQKAVTGESARPMPVRVSAWAVYDVFDTIEGDQVFVGVVSDSQWKSFCKVFEQRDWAGDASLERNDQRVAARDHIIPKLRALFASMSKASLLQLCETANLPFAPIAKPDDLITDPHLLASGGLVTITTEDGVGADLPALPLRMDSQRAGLRHDVPKSGEHSREVMENALGMDVGQIASLERAGAVA